MKYLKSVLVMCFVVLLAACQTNSFLPVHDLPNGTTLGQRTVSDPHAFSPGTQGQWYEVCKKNVVETVNLKTKSVSKEVTYVEPCEAVYIAGIQTRSFSPYVSGIATPIIQAGAMVGSAALLADGIRDSAARNSTTNNNSQGQGQLQGQSAQGGQGGKGGQGGQGGHGGNGFGFGGDGGNSNATSGSFSGSSSHSSSSVNSNIDVDIKK